VLEQAISLKCPAQSHMSVMEMFRQNASAKPCQSLTEMVKIDSMTSSSNTTDPAGPEPPSFGIRHFLFALVLVVLLLLLGDSMVGHRFFRGGRIHRNGSTGQ
jgi:hypothetical protein